MNPPARAENSPARAVNSTAGAVNSLARVVNSPVRAVNSPPRADLSSRASNERTRTQPRKPQSPTPTRPKGSLKRVVAKLRGRTGGARDERERLALLLPLQRPSPAAPRHRKLRARAR
eukprot:1186728-Pyramimonas_sp.AAC.1